LKNDLLGQVRTGGVDKFLAHPPVDVHPRWAVRSKDTTAANMLIESGE